ncbi:hypothetical protein [Streptomyces niveus]|uniref:hypothetical protein n=1 Tax=Streptomyces niveus TaxID=193462 RepID=UPI0036D30E6E
MSTFRIRAGSRMASTPGPGYTSPLPTGRSIPVTIFEPNFSQTTNSPSSSAATRQSRPVRMHHRRYSAMCPAYVRVVNSAWSLPNRTCRRKASASGTTAKSSSTTVQ